MICSSSRFDRIRLLLGLAFSYILFIAQLPVRIGAQEASSLDEAGELIQLSPFEVSADEDRGYARAQGPRFRNGGYASMPSVPVTLIRRADAMVIEFALSNSADRQDVRNQELTASVEQIAEALKATRGLRFENREVQLATGNRSRSLIGKGGVVTSFANFAVFAELEGDLRLFERVKQVRSLVSAAKLSGGTKVIDGPVALWVKRPGESRSELLTKIFADLDGIKKGLGAEFEVLVTGLSGPVQLRSCSESEVELWIDYAFTIRSLREMESKRPAAR